MSKFTEKLKPIIEEKEVNYWKLRPEILLGQNIPKPLHGVAPRVVLGGKWWNKTRQEAYKSTDYHCLACGISKYKARLRQWLEAHELYTIDYKKGRMTYVEAVPLCHLCHNYIHDGRLRALLDQGQLHHAKYVIVLRHGDKVLRLAGLYRLPIAERERLFVEAVKRGEIAPWKKWRLVVNGKEFPPLHASEKAWKKHYESGIKKTSKKKK